MTVVSNRLVGTEHLSLLNSLTIIWQKFTQNLQLFLTPDKWSVTICMRYLLLALILVNTWYAIRKNNKFTLACTLIGWTYLIACLTFYAVYWEYDERALAVLNPLLAFSVIGISNSFIFYPVIILQLWLFPGIVEATKVRNMDSISLNASTPERILREASYSKIKDLNTDDHQVVIELPIEFILHGYPNYFIDLPLITSKGDPIHYRIHLEGKDLRETHAAQYTLVTNNVPRNNQLIYSDQWMNIYRN